MTSCMEVPVHVISESSVAAKTPDQLKEKKPQCLEGMCYLCQEKGGW